ncbi:MAG: MBL fold metallo-hydrolase [Methanosarcinaceae archaeon]|nr:MBL fold metallo-hydrolase [Methanosarcinaceae archaeon]
MTHKDTARLYKLLSGPDEYLFLLKCCILLPDRPGELAALSVMVGQWKANIVRFYYNRSEHPEVVLLEIVGKREVDLRSLIDLFTEKDYFEDKMTLGIHQNITDPESILNVKVRLENKPGTLGAYSKLLSEHGANVIYMLYDEDKDPHSAQIVLATPNPKDVRSILKEMNERDYYYKVLYDGKDASQIHEIIGLKLNERFFMRLNHLLEPSDAEEIKKIIRSTEEVSRKLISFSQEAGEDLEKGDVYAQILALASTSIARTGHRFKPLKMKVIESDDLTFIGWKMPTGGNIYLMKVDGKTVLFDCGYGIYFKDFVSLLKSEGFAPEHITDIYLTHADADHAGQSGLFEREFGTHIHAHPDSIQIFKSGDRSWGIRSRHSPLNLHFTRLINQFTEITPPGKEITTFSTNTIRKIGHFNVIDRFELGKYTFEVIESLSGHIKGNVFFFCSGLGIFISGDYLLDVSSLSNDEIVNLNRPRFLMTSTNLNSTVFKKEMEYLKEWLMEEKKNRKSKLTICPGHGKVYQI